MWIDPATVRQLFGHLMLPQSSKMLPCLETERLYRICENGFNKSMTGSVVELVSPGPPRSGKRRIIDSTPLCKGMSPWKPLKNGL